MSIEEQDPPDQEISSLEVRERVLAEALAHAEAQETRYKQPPGETLRTGRWKSPLSAVVFLLAGYVAIVPPSWIRAEPPPPLTEAHHIHGIRMSLHLQAQQIEAFRVRNQRLPARLDELPVQIPGVRLIRSNNRTYQLVAYRPDGRTVIYDSATPEDFDDVAGIYITVGGS